MDEKTVRIRLKFQDPDILSRQQIEQGLAQSWYLVVLEDVHTVADVAFDIRAAFNLEELCPHGLSLEVEGFVLPASQPARLLKDSDLIRIKRKIDVQGQIPHQARNEHDHIQEKDWFVNGLQRFNGYHGVELRALDEFEKETGGYESEQEEGEMETDISLDERRRPLKETYSAPTRKKKKDRGGKSHKRSNTDVSQGEKLRQTKDLGAGQELAIVQIKGKSNSVINCGVPQSHGVKLVMDEVEKETGKHKKEENGAVLGEAKRNHKKLQADSHSTLSKREKMGKKLKKKQLNCERQGQVSQTGEARPPSNGVQHPVEDKKDDEQKVKRKKLHHFDSQPVDGTFTSTEKMDQLEVEYCDDGLEDWIKHAKKGHKRKAISCLNNDNDVRKDMLKKGTAVDKVRGKKRKKDTELESSLEKLRTPEIKANEGSFLARTPKTKVNGESANGRTPKNEINTPCQEQRPSRSARRKKAKRQWLREQAKMALLTGVETRGFENNRSKVQVVQQELDSSPVGDEVVEVEAEEEVLPIVVRAGHIRFEPYDKDADGEIQDISRPSMPAFLLGDQVKTKRQGQNWGQEKSPEKHKGRATETNSVQSPEKLSDEQVNTRSEHQMDAVDFEKLPALDGAPQEGDVLAYRLVELTASWTPEISSYRVGIVAHWEHTTKIKVDPHPDYPLLGKNASLEDEDLLNVEEMEVFGPYDENGVLEIEFSSLVEVRLMQRVNSGNHEVVPGPRVETGKELGPTTAGAHLIDNPTREPVADIGNSFPTGEQQGVEEGERAESTSALLDLVSEELQRKKMELCQRDEVVTNASAGIMAPFEHPETLTVGSESGKLPNQPKGGRGRKHKFLKSAGVGSIVALLRAQQAL